MVRGHLKYNIEMAFFVYKWLLHLVVYTLLFITHYE